MKPETAAPGRENGAFSPLTPKQEEVALSLALGRTVEATARETGTGARTIRTWAATLPAFSRRVTELRGEMTSRALGRLSDGMAFAATTLRRLLTAQSETVRLGAARAVIELGTKLRESVELEERIAALEANRNGKVTR